jgi:hypothetical protein
MSRFSGAQIESDKYGWIYHPIEDLIALYEEWEKRKAADMAREAQASPCAQPSRTGSLI